MDENEVADLLAKSLKWSSDRAESPAFIEIAYLGDNQFALTAIPGRRFIITVMETDA